MTSTTLKLTIALARVHTDYRYRTRPGTENTRTQI